MVPNPCPRLLGLLELCGLVGHSDDSSDLYQLWIAPHVYWKLTCKSWRGAVVLLEIGSTRPRDFFSEKCAIKTVKISGFSRYCFWEWGLQRYSNSSILCFRCPPHSTASPEDMRYCFANIPLLTCFFYSVNFRVRQKTQDSHGNSSNQKW